MAGDFESWFNGVRQQESGGDPTAINTRTGAQGMFQIMPDNWKPWSEEVLGYEADKNDPAMQEAVSKGKLKGYYDRYGAEGALVAWYGGETNGARWRDGEPDAIGEGGHYSWDAKQGAGDEPSVREYVQQAMAKGDGDYSYRGLPGVSTNPNAYGTTGDIKDPEDLTFGGYLKDKYNSGLKDSALGGILRATWANMQDRGVKEEPLNDDDIKMIAGALPNDPIAQRWVILNAGSRESISRLIAMKQDDAKQLERIDNYVANNSKVGRALKYTAGFGASMVAGAMSDPTIYIPFLGQEAFVTKMIGRVGEGVVSKLALSKVAKYAELAVQGGAINVAERKTAEVYGGYQQNYVIAGVLGGLAGGILHAVGDKFRANVKNDATRRLLITLETAEDHVIANTMGLKMPTEIPSIRKLFESKHDIDFVNSSSSVKLKQLSADGKLAVISKDDLMEHAVALGINPHTTKAFHSPSQGLTVIVKNALKKGDNIDNILAHEVGIHGNLRETIGDKEYGRLRATVEKNMNNPDEAWRTAMRENPGGGWEETLGHWIEKNVDRKDPLFKKIADTFNKVSKDSGVKSKMSDAEIKEFARKSLQGEVNRPVKNGRIISEKDEIFKRGVGKYSWELTEKELDEALLKYKRTPEEISRSNEVFKKEIGKYPWELTEKERKVIYDAYSRNEDTPSSLPPDTVVNDLRMSASNVFNPRLIADVIDVEPSGIANSISRFAEASGLYKTPFGVLFNSQSKLGRDFASIHLDDARIRERDSNLHLSTSRQKDHVKRQLDVHWENYIKSRNEWLRETYTVGVPTPGRLLDFNKAVREHFNATYSTNGSVRGDVSPRAVQASADIAKMREDIIKYAKESGTMFGFDKTHNLVEADFKVFDNEMWRVVDDTKWLHEFNNYAGAKEFKAFLQQYAEKAIKRDVVRAQLEAGYLKTYNERLTNWASTATTVKEGDKTIRKPRLFVLSDRMLDRVIKKKANDWAFGIQDQNLSNLDRHIQRSGGEVNGGAFDHDLGAEGFMSERVPMDTSLKMETPYGGIFSFDSHLRSDDLDKIITRSVNRFAGELALHNTYKTSQDLAIARGKFSQALETGEKHRGLDNRERNLYAWDETILDLRGMRKDTDINSKLNAISGMLRGSAYAVNGANMGANQLGEIGGAIAYSGLKAVNHFCPAFASIMRDVRAGKGTAEFVKDIEFRTFGETIESRVFGQDLQSVQWHDASKAGSKLEMLDGVQTSINYAGKMVSAVNFLPKLTEMMLRGNRMDAIVDTIKWAKGENVGGLLRDPFSAKKLKGAGITPEVATTLKADIQKYMNHENKTFEMDKWMKENPDTFWKWKTLVENQGMRAMTQHTVGNKSLMVNKNAFTRVFFQFKDYSMKVMNSQVARVMTHREIDDVMAFGLSMATNSLVYTGLTYAKAWAYFGDNEAQKKKYLDDRITFGNLAMAGFMRGMAGTAVSLGADAYGAWTGEDTFRTTVEQNTKKDYRTPTAKDALGTTISQLPAVRVATDTGKAVGSAYSLAVHYDKSSQQDIKNLMRIMPLQNSIPIMRLTEMVMDDSQLPEKPRKKLYNPKDTILNKLKEMM